MNPITRFLGEEWVHALAWTLLHSLWQGMLIALLVALAFTALRRHRPEARYGVALGALGLLLAAGVATFLVLYQPEPWAVDLRVQEYGQGLRIEVLPTNASGSGFWGTLFRPDAPWLPILVLGWMLGVAVLTLRSLGEMLFLQHLRFQRSTAAPARWQARVDELAAAFSLPSTIELRQSLRIHTPMVLGFIKPIILMPAGLLTQLPPEEVEMVLAHELAHIRRHDYLVNLLQTLAETLLFFNPAVWWISSLVRAEREHCCDDAALDLLGDERAYVRTLGKMEVYRQENLALALGMLGPRGSVLGRMQRMLQGDQPTRVPPRLFWALLAVVAATTLLALRPPAQPLPEELARLGLSEEAPDTLPKEQRAPLMELRAELLALEEARLDLERELRERERERRAVDQAFSGAERQMRQLELEAREREHQLQIEQEALHQEELRQELQLLDLQAQKLQLAYQRESNQDQPDAEALADIEESLDDISEARIEIKARIAENQLELERRRLEWAEERHEQRRARVEEENAFQLEAVEADALRLELQRALEEIQYRYRAVQDELENRLRGQRGPEVH